jgi:hypothetical protein
MIIFISTARRLLVPEGEIVEKRGLAFAKEKQ